VVGRVGEQVPVRALAVDLLDARPHSSGEREDGDPAADRRARVASIPPSGRQGRRIR